MLNRSIIKEFLIEKFIIFVTVLCHPSFAFSSLSFGFFLLLFMFHLEVFLAKLHNVTWVCSDHFLAELFQDLGELLWDYDLVGAEDAHLTNVCHI